MSAHKKWTVLLAYPELNDNDQVETYHAHVWGKDPHDAAKFAQIEAKTLNEGLDANDFQVLAVYSGHRWDLWTGHWTADARL